MSSRHIVFVASTLIAGLVCLPSCDKAPKTQEQPPAAAKGSAPEKAAAGAAAADKTAAAKAEGTSFGAGVTKNESVSIAAILDDPSAYADKTVRVEGLVTDVCAKRGCWFDMAGDAAGKKMRFKVQDGVMVFPMTAKGRYAIAEGKLVVQQLTLEETRAHAAHEAEEQGKEFDPNTITEPTMVVRLDGTGAVIREKK